MPRPHHHRRRLGPIGRFARRSLRRRIFTWFFGGLFSTALVVGFSISALSRLESPGPQTSWTKTSDWFATQFARDWDDPVARDLFARRAAEALSLDLELLDATGTRLVQVGDECRHHPFTAAVLRDGVALGSVRGCFRGSGPRPQVLLAAIGLGLLGLWLAAGRIARRLARPLDELGEVVKRIGDGDLAARTELSCNDPDEIGVVADAVNVMAGRIEQQVKDQRELLATVSHELRTPLARVRVITELGRDGATGAKTWDDLDREVIEMDMLVGELLASSRLDFGLLAPRRQPLRELVQRALERAGVDVSRVRWEGEPGDVVGDPTLLQRALANLLENARHHGGGVDEVRVRTEGQRVLVEVLDRGPGLPEGGEAVVFEKFKKSADGLGLGLSLVRRIAEVHRGRAFALNRDGGGAAIGFELWSAGDPPALPTAPSSA